MSSRKQTPPTALLILDMVSEFRFPDGRRVLQGARRPAPAIARLKARARSARAPVVYVNDTAGKWESDPRAFIERCTQASAPGRDVVELVRPQLDDDYFIFKPRHSAFFGTPLQTLLEQLRVRRIVLTGISAHQCVLFTAMDAHVREYELIAPADCIGAPTRTQTRHALFILEDALQARVAPSARLRW
jgi:nicotinamidase-related amidase